jgi:hypothetical protein
MLSGAAAALAERAPDPIEVSISSLTAADPYNRGVPTGPREVVIAPQEGRKGRSFAAYLMACVRADALFDAAMTDTGDMVRPVWAMFGASEAALRPFVANLQCGRQALYPDNRHGRRAKSGVELLRSASYRYSFQSHAEGMVVTAYLPELFDLDPGMVDPSGVRFVMLPPAWWVARQTIPTAEIAAHVERCGFTVEADSLPWIAASAYLFAAYLDRRIRAPLYADGRFYVQLMLAMLREGLATWTLREHSYGWRDERRFGRGGHLRFVEVGVERVGLLPGVACKATHAQVEALLAEEVARFFTLTETR